MLKQYLWGFWVSAEAVLIMVLWMHVSLGEDFVLRGRCLGSSAPTSQLPIKLFLYLFLPTQIFLNLNITSHIQAYILFVVSLVITVLSRRETTWEDLYKFFIQTELVRRESLLIHTNVNRMAPWICKKKNSFIEWPASEETRKQGWNWPVPLLVGEFSERKIGECAWGITSRCHWGRSMFSMGCLYLWFLKNTLTFSVHVNLEYWLPNHRYH